MTFLLGVVFTALGLFAFAATALAPATVDKVMGGLNVGIVGAFDDMNVALKPGYLPEITLGGEGGNKELDRCTGEFVEMVGYRVPGVLPLFAAHNNCGGDVTLSWEIGQRIRLRGSDVIYQVVEERHTPKWSSVDQLEGMSGEFMVQTCYYGENTMRFLSLEALSE